MRSRAGDPHALAASVSAPSPAGTLALAVSSLATNHARPRPLRLGSTLVVVVVLEPSRSLVTLPARSGRARTPTGGRPLTRAMPHRPLTSINCTHSTGGSCAIEWVSIMVAGCRSSRLGAAAARADQRAIEGIVGAPMLTLGAFGSTTTLGLMSVVNLG